MRSLRLKFGRGRRRAVWLYGLAAVILAGLLMVAGVWAANHEVKTRFSEQVFSAPSDLPHVQAVMILGARVYDSGRLSATLEDRTLTALKVYQAGKADKILVSGDHGREDYDEVNATKDYLLDHGVPGEDIFMDHAGFDTYDSMYRARDIFGVQKLIISTQDFHLPRAVYTARRLGMEAYGISADRHVYLAAFRNNVRESLARVKAVLDLTRGATPKFLGEAIPIAGDGRLSWD